MMNVAVGRVRVTVQYDPAGTQPLSVAEPTIDRGRVEREHIRAALHRSVEADRDFWHNTYRSIHP